MRPGRPTESTALCLAAFTVAGLTLLDHFIEARVIFYLLYPGEIIRFLVTGGHGGTKLGDAFAPIAGFVVNILYYIAFYEMLLWVYCRFSGSDSRQRSKTLVGRPSVRLVLAFLLALLGGLAYIDYRQHRMNELYRTAIDGGTTEACAAVVELASFRGTQASEGLFRLLAPQQLFSDKRQDIAVQLLAKRNDDEIAARLAELLQPYTSLSLRTDISKALLDMECNRSCTQFILQYLERLSLGELNLEDATESRPDFRFSLQQEEDEILKMLDEVLSKDQALTVKVLTDDYGIGTDYPSRLGLQLIGTLKLRNACHELLRPKVKIYDPALRGKVQSLIRDLNCPPIAGPY